MNNYCVYIHISPSGKKYIGITKQDPSKRWINGYGYKNNAYFSRAIKKYGWDNFEHIIVAKGLTEDEAKWLEIELIRVNESTNLEKGYNITLGGEGTFGYHHTEDARRRMSEAHKGKILSEKHRQNLSKSIAGDKHPMYGKHHSEEQKQKISKSLQGRCHTEDTKLKMSLNHAEQKGKNNPNAKSIICITTKKIFYTAKEGADYYNTSNSSIAKCCKGKVKSAGKCNNQKLVWRYLKHKHEKKFRVAK